MSDDSKSGSQNANLTPSSDFNRGQKLAHEIAQLSPAGLQSCKTIEAVAAQRLEDERRDQKRSHAYRVLKEKTALLEKYILDASSKPADIQADPSADLKIINEQAERMVGEKEANYLRTIERETEKSLWKVVTMERGGHDFSQEMTESELGE